LKPKISISNKIDAETVRYGVVVLSKYILGLLEAKDRITTLVCDNGFWKIKE
jgi:hypothetical protein